MKIEMGESLLYSWLRHEKSCQIVQTNWKASPKWPFGHEDELSALMSETASFFQEKYGYKIYKKTASLSQLLRQGECDAVGLSMRDGIPRYYAVDVAFHEDGLNYGFRDETVMKVTAKSLRTAFCLYGYFNTTSADIIFASPKIGASILSDLQPCIEDVNSLLNKHGLDFCVSIIANEEFNDKIMQPILKISNSVADTSELFIRGYRMYAMFSKSAKSGAKPSSTQSEKQC